MRLTFPTSPIKKSKKNKKDLLITKMIEILWHTIAPIVCTYIMMKYEQPLMMIPILAIIVIRIERDEK